MKASIFSILLLINLFLFVATGQSRLGSSVQDIKVEFSERKYYLDPGYNDDKVFYVTLKQNWLQFITFLTMKTFALYRLFPLIVKGL